MFDRLVDVLCPIRERRARLAASGDVRDLLAPENDVPTKPQV